ncbi:MAG: Rrf2 family transcriptional regulator [Balneolales bacterium]
MVLSKACTYGILASLYVARETHQENEFVSIRQMSDELNISFHFLTKILQKLTKSNILISLKGPKGGVALSRPPKLITMLDIVIAIDGPDLFSECLLGLPGCGSQKPCPVHEQWTAAREDLRIMFQGKTLADTSHDVEALNLRLSLPKMENKW